MRKWVDSCGTIRCICSSEPRRELGTGSSCYKVARHDWNWIRGSLTRVQIKFSVFEFVNSSLHIVRYSLSLLLVLFSVLTTFLGLAAGNFPRCHADVAGS